MKIRTDFVTNSSSSSFILAKESKLNDKQKQAILNYVEESLLGEAILSPDSTEEEIQQVFDSNWEFENKWKQQRVRQELKEGKTIHTGVVDFECTSYSYAEIYTDIWEILQDCGDGNFVMIDGDLSY